MNATNVYNKGKADGASSATLGRIVIGSSTSNAVRTFDVKSKLPNHYNKLTINNFGAIITKLTYTESQIGSGTGAFFSSYNASTGVLTTNKLGWHQYAHFDIVCFYIP